MPPNPHQYARIAASAAGRATSPAGTRPSRTIHVRPCRGPYTGARAATAAVTPASAGVAAAVATRLTTARLDLNTPVSRLCANARAKAVLDADLPGLTTRPEFPFFKSMSLNTLKKMSRGQMSDADLAKVQAELAQLDQQAAEDAAK